MQGQFLITVVVTSPGLTDGKLPSSNRVNMGPRFLLQPLYRMQLTMFATCGLHLYCNPVIKNLGWPGTSTKCWAGQNFKYL